MAFWFAPLIAAAGSAGTAGAAAGAGAAAAGGLTAAGLAGATAGAVGAGTGAALGAGALSGATAAGLSSGALGALGAGAGAGISGLASGASNPIANALAKGVMQGAGNSAVSNPVANALSNGLVSGNATQGIGQAPSLMSKVGNFAMDSLKKEFGDPTKDPIGTMKKLGSMNKQNQPQGGPSPDSYSRNPMSQSSDGGAMPIAFSQEQLGAMSPEELMAIRQRMMQGSYA